MARGGSDASRRRGPVDRKAGAAAPALGDVGLVAAERQAQSRAVRAHLQAIGHPEAAGRRRRPRGPDRDRQGEAPPALMPRDQPAARQVDLQRPGSCRSRASAALLSRGGRWSAGVRTPASRAPVATARIWRAELVRRSRASTRRPPPQAGRPAQLRAKGPGPGPVAAGAASGGAGRGGSGRADDPPPPHPDVSTSAPRSAARLRPLRGADAPRACRGARAPRRPAPGSPSRGRAGGRGSRSPARPTPRRRSTGGSSCRRACP